LVNELKIKGIFKIFYYGMNAASVYLLFISSLLSPGEAGLAFVRPAFLFPGHVNSPIASRFQGAGTAFSCPFQSVSLSSWDHEENHPCVTTVSMVK
jgi:hypothetical protein